MALTKVVYVNGATVIYAENLNAIQDAIIALENAGIPTNVVQYVAQTLTDAQKAQARTNIGAASVAGTIEKPSNAQDKDFLCYNGTSGEWEATAVPVWQWGAY